MIAVHTLTGKVDNNISFPSEKFIVSLCDVEHVSFIDLDEINSDNRAS